MGGDGTPFDFTYWFPGEPITKYEECIEMNFKREEFQDGWNDVSCEREGGRGFACKKTGSSELGNGSPRPRPRPRPRPGPKTCPRECFDRTVELLKTKCEGPNPAAIIKCVFKGTSDSVKPCLPCVCENICKAVTKGGPIYNLCTACRPP